MAAPELKYAIGNSASTTNSSSISNSDTSLPLTSSTNFQSKSGEGMVLLDEGNATEELSYSTGLSGSNLTIPLANRGLEGGSAQAHSQGSSVKGILTAGMWNDLIDSLLNILDQSTGGIKTNPVFSGIDFNGTEIIIDADADTSITADTDDRLDYKLGGSDRFRMGTSDLDLVTSTANIQVAGADPKRALYVDGPAMHARTTSGAAASSTETTTNKVMKKGWAFDKDSDEFVQFKTPAPKNWDLGTITAEPYWTADAGTTGTVAFAVQALALSNDDAIDTAFGTAQTSTDTFIATGDEHIGPATSAITVGNTPAKGDMLVFQIYRDVSEDTFDADAILIGLRIQFGVGQYDDQ